MKRSAASAWNYLLSLEGGEAPKQTRQANDSAAEHVPSVSRTATPPDTTEAGGPHELLHLNDGVKLVIGMVGLPARGKSHVAKKVTNYFSWIGYAARHFEVSALRREKLGAVTAEKFFDPSNKIAGEARAQFRIAALDSLIAWLQEEGQVAVYDASNATPEQRRIVQEKLESAFRPTPQERRASHRQSWCRIIWVELHTDDPVAVERNFFEATIKSADYEGLSKTDAFAQFQKKMDFYKSTYVGLEEEETSLSPQTSYIKISDGGKRVVAYNVTGYLQSKLVSFLMNVHSEPKVVILARHGQTDYNVHDRVGGDSDLTESGRLFGKNLGRFCKALEKKQWEVVNGSKADPGYSFREFTEYEDGEGRSTELVVWTSTANRALQTAESINPYIKVAWNALTEIDAGVCESMTYTEIRVKMPLEYAERQKDKYYWRYPRGESYADVTRRLEPVIFEIERQRRPVLVVAHRAVIRCLLGYFEGTPKDQVPFLPVPLHSVVVLRSGREGWKSQRWMLQPQVESEETQTKEVI